MPVGELSVDKCYRIFRGGWHVERRVWFEFSRSIPDKINLRRNLRHVSCVGIDSRDHVIVAGSISKAPLSGIVRHIPGPVVSIVSFPDEVLPNPARSVLAHEITILVSNSQVNTEVGLIVMVPSTSNMAHVEGGVPFSTLVEAPELSVVVSNNRRIVLGSYLEPGVCRVSGILNCESSDRSCEVIVSKIVEEKA